MRGCRRVQIFQLSSLLELRHGISANYQDLISWLPDELALLIFSYLDARSLCRAAAVCSQGRLLSERVLRRLSGLHRLL